MDWQLVIFNPHGLEDLAVYFIYHSLSYHLTKQLAQLVISTVLEVVILSRIRVLTSETQSNMFTCGCTQICMYSRDIWINTYKKKKKIVVASTESNMITLDYYILHYKY